METPTPDDLPPLNHKYPFEFFQHVEVLGFDGEPKYVGVFVGRGDSDRTYAVYNDDTGEVHYPPKDHVQAKEG